MLRVMEQSKFMGDITRAVKFNGCCFSPLLIITYGSETILLFPSFLPISHPPLSELADSAETLHQYVSGLCGGIYTSQAAPFICHGSPLVGADMLDLVPS